MSLRYEYTLCALVIIPGCSTAGCMQGWLKTSDMPMEVKSTLPDATVCLFDVVLIVFGQHTERV